MKTFSGSIAWLLLVLAVICGTAPAQKQSQNQNHPQGKTTLMILANRHIQDQLWPVFVSTLARDAASEQALANGQVEIVPVGKETPGPALPDRIEVELLGRCDSRWNPSPLRQDGPLGWVIGTSGSIAPVIYVDCGRIAESIGPQTDSMGRDQWLQATSEAISHVILHEWIHIATQSPAHATSGIMQPELSELDLTSPIAEKRSRAKKNSTPASR
jgi:hypothetical protein